MPSGKKKTELAANLKIRRCVVRIKKMKTPPNKNNKRTAPARAGPASLKKRQVGPAKSNTSLSTSFKAKDRLKTPIATKNVKTVQQTKKAATPVVEELPPTIAAGRSRRAHKPNPKYANDDLLTPKSLKPSAVSSQDDILNKASNDSEPEVIGPRSSKTLKTLKHRQIDTDSDFDNEDNEENEDSDASIYERRTRGRAGKTTSEPVTNRSKVGVTSASTLNKTAPTQLQQLRRSLNASNLSPLAMGRKRKLEESSLRTTPVVANKRANIQASTPKLSESNGIVKRRRSPSLAPTESKAKLSATTVARRETPDRKPAVVQEKKSSPLSLTRSASVANLKTVNASKTQQNTLQRSIANRNSLGKASSASTPSLLRSSQGKSTSSPSASATSPATKSRNSLLKTVPSNKQQSSTTASAGSKKTATAYSSSDAEETPTFTIDDFETMPTFTIVNINDIINKKGDVLISEASETNKNQSAASTKPEPTRIVQKPETQQQSQQNKPLSKKQGQIGVKTSQPLSTSTPLFKKTAEKATGSAQNKVINRNSSGATKSSPPTQKSTISLPTTKPSTRSGGNNASDKKPAPRILNSVVSPRTKPIKPVIANLDISDDDPSGSISLYTDDDDYDEDDGVLFKNGKKLNDTDYSGNESEVVESKKKQAQPKRSPASNVSGKSKVSTPPNATKENSAAVNNCLPKKQAQTLKPLPSRKLSPEKVVVQREGNKIIKKITCFETWYVINIPADAPEEYERNTLDMPLIELANSAKTIKLPSDKWTTKVTLYELKKSMSKSDLTVYNGDLTEQNIKESDRANYQPSCVMFRRTVADRVKLQLPYDRAVIFKNKTFFTNIEGKNVKLVGAPTAIKEISEVETLLNIVDGLTLQSPFVEPAATIL